MQNLTHRQQAEQEAIRLAVARLSALSDWPARCRRLGLGEPDGGGALRLAVLGATLELRPPAFEAAAVATGRPAKPADRLLALHYLLGEAPLAPAGAWITFRDFPGGAFYWEPFLARTVKPLTAAVGNDLDALGARLARFSADLEPLAGGGLQATVAGLGALRLRLVYRPGDDEFPPSADVLYDARARRLLCAEDAAALGSRLCLGLL